MAHMTIKDVHRSFLKSDINQRISRLNFIVIAGVTIFLYFDLSIDLVFLQLIGGYLIKVWVPPLILLSMLLFRKAMGKDSSSLNLNISNLMLFLYALFGLTAMLYHHEVLLMIKYYLIMIAPVWFYYVLTRTLNNNRDVELMLKVIFACCVFYSFETTYLNFLYLSNPALTFELKTSAGNVVGGSGFSELKIQGDMISRGFFLVENSRYCGMLLPGVLFGILLFVISNAKIRYLYILLSMFMIMTMLIGMSRSGIAAAFVGVAVLLWSLIRYSNIKKSIILLYSSLIILGLAAYFITAEKNTQIRFAQIIHAADIEFVSDFLNAYDLIDSNLAAIEDPHIQTISQSFEAFLDNPIMGAGYTYVNEQIQEHNRYLFILASSGILAFLAYVVFFVTQTAVTGKMLQKYARSDDPMIKYGYLYYACNIMVLVKLMVEGPEGFYYWIIFALSSAWARNLNRDQRCPVNKLH